MAGRNANYEAMVFRVCDKLLAAGKRVSLRNVIAALPNGGTNRILGPILRDWKVERDYKPRLVVNDLPEAVQGELVGFARSVADAVRASEANRFEGVRLELEARLKANDELRDDALTECDGMREENARLIRKAAAVRSENETLRVANDRLKARLDRIRAEEFWDQVMREIRDLMPVGGSLPMDDILAGLRQSIHRGARLHREPLNADTLRKKMAVRDSHRKYFEEGPGGALIRKAG